MQGTFGALGCLGVGIISSLALMRELSASTPQSTRRHAIWRGR
eukprot:CAMPEP_0206262110 /NCGR_PEP_ID=MMETSP0047_2-20121206/28038_1 /ASSEMBLY_ACC=CAM_ASM_000192 /TAXON_ID=195065 /ORGANISM="Chroomonas mesostigmatica_cf, Strain CCMP1168" /LENGTH=42 /DNA_ID= /DNA_START= /DNA_END= /DNA_ORIENTATION=